MNLPDALMAEAKSRAAESGRTVTSMVEEALRLLLNTAGAPSPSGPLPSYGTPGAGFLVDLEDRDAVWATLDEQR